MLSWPYSTAGGGHGVPQRLLDGVSETVTYDTVPVGEVEVRRGDRVQASDGAIGHVDGLVIDPASHHVTHVLLQEGHLWGRKEVAIPISAVTSTDDGIWLSLDQASGGRAAAGGRQAARPLAQPSPAALSGRMGQPLAPQPARPPMPWPASTRSATAIWSAAEAWLADDAYWPPP